MERGGRIGANSKEATFQCLLAESVQNLFSQSWTKFSPHHSVIYLGLTATTNLKTFTTTSANIN